MVAQIRVEVEAIGVRVECEDVESVAHVHADAADVGDVVEGVERVAQIRTGLGEQVAGRVIAQVTATRTAQRNAVHQVTTVGRRFRQRLTVEHLSQRFDVVHGQSECGDFGPLFVATAAATATTAATRRLVGHHRLRNGFAQRLERLIDLFHASTLASIGRFTSVLAQRRRCLFGFGLTFDVFLLFHFQPLLDGPGPQTVLVRNFDLHHLRRGVGRRSAAHLRRRADRHGHGRGFFHRLDQTSTRFDHG